MGPKGIGDFPQESSGSQNRSEIQKELCRSGLPAGGSLPSLNAKHPFLECIHTGQAGGRILMMVTIKGGLFLPAESKHVAENPHMMGIERTKRGSNRKE